jgi:hypothetical protein
VKHMVLSPEATQHESFGTQRSTITLHSPLNSFSQRSCDLT